MTFRRLVLSTLLIGSLCLPALADERGSEADREACTPDVFRLCNDFVPDEGEIVKCLQGKGPRLSPACHQVFFPGKPAKGNDTQIASDAPASSLKTKAHRRKTAQ